MAQLPKINKMQFGIIDEVYMNTLADAVEEFKNMKPALDVLVSKTLKMKSPSFMAQITSVDDFVMENVLIGEEGEVVNIPIAWKYTWSAVGVENFDEDSFNFIPVEPNITTADVQESIGDGESGYAFNLAELSNKKTYEEEGVINGVKVSSPSYPLGFLPMSIRKFSFVVLQKYMSNDGQVFYLFDRQGTHDGTCEA